MIKRLLAVCTIQTLLTIFCVVAFSRVAGAQQKDWQAQASADLVLTAMRDELERSKSALKLDQVAAPYYIEYRVIDVEEISAEASFGALRLNLRARERFLRVVARIGDYKQDSYFEAGEGVVSLLPVDGDILALRHELWLATDRAYKAAAEALTAKQAQLKQFTVDQPVDDFAHADPVQWIGQLVTLNIDPSPWIKVLQEASGLYKNDPQIQASDAALQFSAVNRYYVNSEGTVVRNGKNFYEVSAHCSTQAADGMDFGRSMSFVETNPADLPSPGNFLQHASELAASMKQFRDAGLMEEEYRGPVLFSAHAGATLFAGLVGENVLGVKPALGKSGRTTGAFATDYKSRVLPSLVSVEDDPTIATYAGEPLLGNYDVDDEGMRAMRVPVIDKGILVNYVMGREPIRDFPSSNGHGRARIPSNPPGPSLGNLIVRSSEALPPGDLKKKFLEMCQQRELPYCYRVETLASPLHLTPHLLYRVYVKDGHEELVRGAVFGDLDTRALRSDLVAVGDDVHVDNMLLNIPHSVAAPSLLFDELEIKRANLNNQKLPEYPPPLLTK